MAYVPGFSNDIFISYSHLDDHAVDGRGWVSDFHQRLQIEIEEELGASVQIWRDARIGPADDFSRDLDRQVRASALLLAILSPGYLNSQWYHWELRGFAGVRRTGDLWVGTKCRAIKIVKRPVDRSRLRVLSETGVVEFFEKDATTGRAYELDATSERYKRSLTDLAQELGIILRAMRRARSVFLGAASATLRGQRDRVREELDVRGYRVLSLPEGTTDDPRGVVRAAVTESSLAVLFYDRTVQPSKDPAEALAAAERSVTMEERARHVLVVRGHPGVASPTPNAAAAVPSNGEWLVEPPTHTLYQTVLQMMGTPMEATPASPTFEPVATTAPAAMPDAARSQRLVRVYLGCDRKDHPLLLSNRARNLRDHLLALGFEVRVPLAEDADAGEFSRDNRKKLQQCDGVLVYWGTARQAWFDERLGELTQARGWRHGREFAAIGAYVADPRSPVKQNYETREVDELIKQFDAFDLSDAKLVRFVERLGQPL